MVTGKLFYMERDEFRLRLDEKLIVELQARGIDMTSALEQMKAERQKEGEK